MGHTTLLGVSATWIRVRTDIVVQAGDTARGADIMDAGGA